MNFDKYKIKDELLEIYSDSEENFSVGKMLSLIHIQRCIRDSCNTW